MFFSLHFYYKQSNWHLGCFGFLHQSPQVTGMSPSPTDEPTLTMLAIRVRDNVWTCVMSSKQVSLCYNFQTSGQFLTQCLPLRSQSKPSPKVLNPRLIDTNGPDVPRSCCTPRSAHVGTGAKCLWWSRLEPRAGPLRAWSSILTVTCVGLCKQVYIQPNSVSSSV